MIWFVLNVIVAALVTAICVFIVARLFTLAIPGRYQFISFLASAVLALVIIYLGVGWIYETLNWSPLAGSLHLGLGLLVTFISVFPLHAWIYEKLLSSHHASAAKSSNHG